jgi:ribosomal protein S18 acetylase RimI-like enzyme
MKISIAAHSDLPRILAIQKQAYLSEAAIYSDYALPPLVQSLEEIYAEFESKTFLKVDVEGALVGSVRIKLVDDTCLIERLIVDPRFQKRGLGSALLTHAESVFAQASRFELFTGARSAANIRLYERHGYTRFREQALSPAVTLIYMQKLREQKNGSQSKKETPAREA